MMNSSELLSEYGKYIAPVMNFNKQILHRGEGCYLEDVEGKRYLDMSAEQFCAILGHGEKEVAEKAFSLAQRFVNIPGTYLCDEVLFAAKAVYDICPEMDARIFFLSTGAEANECCLRYAKQMSGNKSGVISFDVGYHGLSLGTEGYSMSRRHVKPQLNHSYYITAPRILNVRHASQSDWKESVLQFKTILEEHHEDICAAMFEPIVSTGGLLFPPKEFWREIRALCDKYQVYLAFDECQTGFGRTGSWFYYQQLDCVPDFLVCAKGMGLGFPVSMVAFNGHTFPESSFVMNHISSHQNDPLSAGMVSYCIREINDHHYLESNLNKGSYILNMLKAIPHRVARGKKV